MYKDYQNIKRNVTRTRISLFILLFAVLFSVVIYKLFSIQVLNSTRYQLAAKKSDIRTLNNETFLFLFFLNYFISAALNFALLALMFFLISALEAVTGFLVITFNLSEDLKKFFTILSSSE